MAKPKKIFSKLKKGSTVHLKIKSRKFTVMAKPPGAKAFAAHPDDVSDVADVKPVIALSIARHVCKLSAGGPDEPPVDPNAATPPDFQTNSASKATEINSDGLDSAGAHGYTWTSVDAAEVEACTTIGKLMDLVIAHLT